jgi:hypothetical protein
MTAFDCPEHGTLVLDLARGRLDDVRAEEAERAQRDCAECSRWWDETFSEPALAKLDSEVASVFREFVPPRRRRHGWLAAAAVAVLAVGIGATSLLWRDAPAPEPPSEDQVSAWDFEAGALNEAVAAADESADGSDETSRNPAVFVGDFESGDLSGWSTGS